MIRSQLIDKIYTDSKFEEATIDKAVRCVLATLAGAIEEHQRIEVRGFGVFTVREQPPRKAHNPKTGERLITKPTFRVHFKPGKGLKERVDSSKTAVDIADE